eukprot:TRINITY_DN6989_c0_g1_i2.p1 TRINITY_DN6989_c0_g1~~TRINITY_DN6989_c0_g1_i2.p1  ORF type:complete len:575 (-),score=151.39 TRINITY_DN6989_c0_g1_i2:96-1820(-)
MIHIKPDSPMVSRRRLFPEDASDESPQTGNPRDQYYYPEKHNPREDLRQKVLKNEQSKGERAPGRVVQVRSPPRVPPRTAVSSERNTPTRYDERDLVNGGSGKRVLHWSEENLDSTARQMTEEEDEMMMSTDESSKPTPPTRMQRSLSVLSTPTMQSKNAVELTLEMSWDDMGPIKKQRQGTAHRPSQLRRNSSKPHQHDDSDFESSGFSSPEESETMSKKRMTNRKRVSDSEEEQDDTEERESNDYIMHPGVVIASGGKRNATSHQSHQRKQRNSKKTSSDRKGKGRLEADEPQPHSQQSPRTTTDNGNAAPHNTPETLPTSTNTTTTTTPISIPTTTTTIATNSTHPSHHTTTTSTPTQNGDERRTLKKSKSQIVFSWVRRKASSRSDKDKDKINNTQTDDHHHHTEVISSSPRDILIDESGKPVATSLDSAYTNSPILASSACTRHTTTTAASPTATATATNRSTNSAEPTSTTTGGGRNMKRANTVHAPRYHTNNNNTNHRDTNHFTTTATATSTYGTTTLHESAPTPAKLRPSGGSKKKARSNTTAPAPPPRSRKIKRSVSSDSIHDSS